MRKSVRILDDCFNGLVITDFKSFGYDRSYLAYNFPYSLTYAQFHGFLTDLPEKASDSLIAGKPSGGGEDIVLHKRNGRMGDLGAEVAGLALAEPEVLLAILEDDLYGPTHRINLICLEEIKRGIGSKNSTPGSILAAAHIEQTDCHILNECVHHNIVAAMQATVFHSLGLGATFAYDGLGRILLTVFAEREPHTFLPHLDHAEIIASDAPCLDEPDYILAGEPTVGQKIIKPVSDPDGPADHLLEEYDLAPYIVLHSSGCRTILSAFLFIAPVKFSLRHGMVAALARLSDKFEINHHLALAIADGKYQGLEAQYHLMGDVTEDTANLLGMETSLGIISVIDNKAYGISRMILAHRDPAPELTRNMVHDLAPVYHLVIDKPVKDILRRAA